MSDERFEMAFESAADYARRLRAERDSNISTAPMLTNDTQDDETSVAARWDENETQYYNDEDTTNFDDDIAIDYEYDDAQRQERMQTTSHRHPSQAQQPESSNTIGAPPVHSVVPARPSNTTNQNDDDIDNPFDHPLENPEYTYDRRPPATTPGAIAVVRRGQEEQDLEDDQVWDPTAPVDLEQANPATDRRNTRTFIDADVALIRKTWHGMSTRQAILVATLILLIIAGAAAGIAVSVLKSKDDNGSPAAPQGDCDFSNIAQPNPLLQCACNGNITTLTDGLLQNYEGLKQSFVPSVLSSFEYPADSCEPQNAALLWLAADTSQGLSRESMRNRYLLSLMYAYWNGIDWLLSDGWLSSDSECTWQGVNCTDGVLVDDIDLYDNNVQGTLFTELGLFQNLGTCSKMSDEMLGSVLYVMHLTHVYFCNSRSICRSKQFKRLYTSRDWRCFFA